MYGENGGAGASAPMVNFDRLAVGKMANEAKRPDLHTIIGSNEESIGMLHESIKNLEDRLHCILNPVSRESVGGGTASPKAERPIDRLQATHLWIRQATERVNEIAARLQL